MTAGQELANNRFLVFSTTDNLGLLSRHNDWFADGTFKTVPLLFHQLYSLCVRIDGAIIPAVYALLPNRTQAMYEALLQVLKDNNADLNPATIMTDFEEGAINAFRSKLPGIECTGCFFHLCQNIFRRIQEDGLQVRYSQDPQFALVLRMLPALAFAPVGDVIDYFEALEEIFPEEAEEVVSYFEKNYVGGLRPNGQRRTPRFPIALWNVNERTLSGQERTNNAQEGWHRRFATIVTCHHPTIWKVIDSFKAEQATSERQLERLAAGHPGPKRRKTYEDCDKRLRTLIYTFEQRPALEFLRGVAQNLAFNVVE